ncbi:hypothetical protein LTR33_014715 [Friedmanniomyces endolithicus]|nr:hypothetical protein LTR33_014715 [Friedmanniomyces endolithicus]
MGESEGEGEEQDEVQDAVQGEGEAGGEAGGEAAGGVPSIEYLRGQLRETRSMVKSLDLGRHNTVFDLNERLLDVFATDDFDTSGRRHLSAAIMELTQYVSDVLAQTDDQGDDAVRATPQPMPALTGSAAARFAVFRRNTRSMLQEIQLRNLLETPMPLGDYLAMINSNISPDMEEFGEEEGRSFLARLQDQGEEVVWAATTATVMSSA